MDRRENIEVSIFKDIEHEKTMIAAVMDPDKHDGVGPMLMRLVPKVKTVLDNLKYTGKIHFRNIDEDEDHPKYIRGADESKKYTSSISEEIFNLTFRNQVVVFGGAAYHLHKINDRSKFSHVLPGVHDVDVICETLVVGFPAGNQNPEHPLDRNSVKRLGGAVRSSSGKAVGILNQENNILSFILRNLVSTIRDHIIEETDSHRGISREYDLFVNGKDNVVVLTPPYTPGDSSSEVLYTEVVSNFFRIKVVDEGCMLKTQVEIRSRDNFKRVSAMDHAFEIVMTVTGNKFNQIFDRSIERINGIDVYTKEKLFSDNMASLLDRSFNADYLGRETRLGKLASGKCAQDFLRVVYILLQGLQERRPRWVESNMVTTHFGVREGVDMAKEMVKYMGRKGTPIEIFLFLSRYIEPCVSASKIDDIEVFQNSDENTNTRSSIGRDFRTIIDEFRRGFPNSKQILEQNERRDFEFQMARSRDIFNEKISVVHEILIDKSKRSAERTRLGFYLSQDFNISIIAEVYDAGENDVLFYGNMMLLSRDGVMMVSSPRFSGGREIRVTRHADINKYSYQFILPDGKLVFFTKSEFIKAFEDKYPGVTSAEFDERFWYKAWLKNTT